MAAMPKILTTAHPWRIGPWPISSPPPPRSFPPGRPPLARGAGASGGTTDPDEILDRFVDWVAEVGFELYPAQEEALLEILAGKHVILNTPTGSGKSLVALGLHFKGLCEGKTSFYTSRSRPWPPRSSSPSARTSGRRTWAC